MTWKKDESMDWNFGPVNSPEEKAAQESRAERANRPIDDHGNVGDDEGDTVILQNHGGWALFDANGIQASETMPKDEAEKRAEYARSKGFVREIRQVIINCTPHPITVAGQTIAPSGIVPRVSVSSVPDGDIIGIPVVRTEYGSVEGLPVPVQGVTLVVSALVLAALAGTRPDCVAPDTSPASAIRDDAGRIIGVRRFTR